MFDEFIDFLVQDGKCTNTIKGYVLDIKGFLKWFNNNCGKEFTILIRQNMLDFKTYLQNTKRNNAKTINHKLSSLKKYNEFLLKSGIQDGIIIFDKDMVKIQREYVSLTKVSDLETRQFLQAILESGSKRNYAISVLLAYSGLRISEALNIQIGDYNLEAGECIIRNGKGNKQRTVILNSKVTAAIKEYLLERNSYSTASISNYLFLSKRSKKIDRTVLNKIFNEYSDKVTPHQLRHFFCTNALIKISAFMKLRIRQGTQI
jgi:integrase/recombinase XerD